MNDEIIKAANYAIKQFGTLHDIVVALIQLIVMIELTFSVGYIHNQIYPPFVLKVFYFLLSRFLRL